MLVLSMSTDLKRRSSKADSKAWISERNGVAPGNSIRLDYGTFHQAESEACGMTPLSARWSLSLWGRAYCQSLHHGVGARGIWRHSHQSRPILQRHRLDFRTNR